MYIKSEQKEKVLLLINSNYHVVRGNFIIICVEWVCHNSSKTQEDYIFLSVKILLECRTICLFN